VRLPVSWLKDYIDVPFPAKELADKLTMSGTAVERVEKKGDESVLVIEVTTNRPDCLSVLGLAQELSALTGKKVNHPKIVSPEPARKIDSFKVRVEDKKGCPKYTARLIQGVTVRPSPERVQKFLNLLDHRPIHNAVDATNFVLFETGQPLHAFDADKIKGGIVLVRRARKSEKLLGIDGVQYELDESVLVIADAERPIAMAGVIGGKLTEVTENTRNILLESAYFDPTLVRQASRRFKVFTQSSYRFERGVDCENVAFASARVRDLILQWGGGMEAGKMIDQVSSIPHLEKDIPLCASRVEKLLGFKISAPRIRKTLSQLGFVVKSSGVDKFSVTSKSSRRDVTQEADLIEEVLRIEGFEKVPPIIPVTRPADGAGYDQKVNRILALKKFLAAQGFDEIVSYSLLSGAFLENSGFEDLKRAQKIVNPLSAEQEFLRPTLKAGMLGAILFNIHRRATALKFFEIGNCFVDGKEETTLSLAIYGLGEDNWQRRFNVSFFDLKGALQNILTYFKIDAYEFEEDAGCPAYDNACTLELDGHKLASLGSIHPGVLKKWDIPHEVFFAEIRLDDILSITAAPKPLKVKAVLKFPSVRRDIAFVVDEKISVRALEVLMKKIASPHLSEARLFDQFVGKNIPTGKRSLAFSLTYQKDSGTFTDDEVQELQNRLGEALKNQYKVEFR